MTHLESPERQSSLRDCVHGLSLGHLWEIVRVELIDTGRHSLPGTPQCWTRVPGLYKWRNKLNTGKHCAHIRSFLSTPGCGEVIWPAVLNSYHLDCLDMMDYNPELWAQVNIFYSKLLFVRCFIISTEMTLGQKELISWRFSWLIPALDSFIQ